eukprot:84430-Pelagomonas_calceolata.AAC.2
MVFAHKASTITQGVVANGYQVSLLTRCLDVLQTIISPMGMLEVPENANQRVAFCQSSYQAGSMHIVFRSYFNSTQMKH